MTSTIPTNLGVVTVRYIREEDHVAYVSLEKDVDVKLYVNGPSTKTEQQLLGTLRRYEPTETLLAIAETVSDLFVGRCGLLQMKNAEEAEIFCLLAKTHWRKGIGEIVVRFLAQVAAEQGKVAVGIVNPANKSSLSLMKKLGWIADGIVSEAGKQYGHLRYVQPSA